jgi:hypothetical protein
MTSSPTRDGCVKLQTLKLVVIAPLLELELGI